MCQLTLIKTNDVELTKELLAQQLIINTQVSHQDGSGVLYYKEENKGWYMEKGLLVPSQSLSILREKFIDPIDSIKPVIAHVRRASTKMKNKSEKHAHPFFNKDTKLVFAHNGTLRYDYKYRDRKKEMDENWIDSQIFFAELCTMYQENKNNMVESLQKTMEMFSGKFAFLIRDEKGNIFVVRGLSATLFQATIQADDEIIAVVVNTELPDLKNNLETFRMRRMLEKKPVDIEYKVLNTETIYKLNDFTLEKIGEIKETKSFSSGATVVNGYDEYADYHYGAYNNPYGRYNQLPARTEQRNRNKSNSKEIDNGGQGSAFYKALKKTAVNLGLTIPELDELLFASIGVPIASLEFADLRKFNATIGKTLYSIVSSDKERSEKEEIWKEINKKGGKFDRVLAYSKKQSVLQFPWFLNSVEALKNHQKFT